MNEYINSKEKYKGFELRGMMLRYHESNPWHRRCYVFKNGERVAICKTKKDAKSLIDEGCFQ